MDSLELFPETAKMPVFWANLKAKETIVINQGGTSSGKSHAIIRILFLYAIMYPKIKIEVVAGTFPKLEQDTLEIAENLYRDNSYLKSFIRLFHQTKHTFFLKNGSKIVFKAYEKAKDADGPKRDILYLSEARNITYALAEQLIRRSKIKTFIDYNPVAEFWAHDKIIRCPIVNGKKEYPSVKVIRSWHIHNYFLSKEMHDKIENIQDPEMWKAYARGLTAKITGLVYPGWVELKSFPLDAPKIIWGVDLGFTNDPTVILKCAVDWMGFDYIFEAYGYAPGIPSGDMAHIMVTNGYKRGQPVYMDHNDAIRRQLRQLGILAINALKGAGSVEAGILYLRSCKVAFVERQSFKNSISETTPLSLKEEIKRHSFLVDADGNPTNKPEHQFSHGPSAARYASFTHAVRNGKVKHKAPVEQ